MLEITLDKHQILHAQVFLFETARGLCSLRSILMEKIVVKHEANDFVFSNQKVCLFPLLFFAEKAKSK